MRREGIRREGEEREGRKDERWGARFGRNCLVNTQLIFSSSKQ